MNLHEQAAQPSHEEYRMIPLTQGKFAIVDAEDFARINQWKWYAKKHPNGEFRAYRHSPRDENYKQETISMSRAVMNAPPGSIVDHINHDGLDNRRSINLRFSTHAENMRNKRKLKRGLSRFKGVSWSSSENKWVARITTDHSVKHLGYFDSEELAGAAYKLASASSHGAFACAEAHC